MKIRVHVLISIFFFQAIPEWSPWATTGDGDPGDDRENPLRDMLHHERFVPVGDDCSSRFVGHFWAYLLQGNPGCHRVLWKLFVSLKLYCELFWFNLTFVVVFSKKLISQFKRFGYYKIQRQLVELVYISSLSISKPKDRKNFVLDLGRLIGGPWERILAWKTIAVEKVIFLNWSKFSILIPHSYSPHSQEVRTFINGFQDRYPLFAAYSVPVEDCRIGDYHFVRPRESHGGMWLDVNFKPATVRFAGCVVLAPGGADPLEMSMGFEIEHRNVTNIDWKSE